MSKITFVTRHDSRTNIRMYRTDYENLRNSSGVVPVFFLKNRIK